GQITSRPGDREPSSRKKRTFIPSEHRKQFRVEDDAELLDAPPRSKQLPPLDLLIDEKSIRPNERHINQNAGLIEKTLAEFGLPAKVVGFQVGPTITQFAVEPGYVERAGAEGESARQKVRVSQISALQRDLALALSAQRLRIEAPVPGRSFVGIEVPNLRSNVVRLRPILESSAFYQSDSPLALALGRDVSGQTVIADLARMPHLLIAGTTGSGKSVCISAITVCLAMNNSPEDLRLVMIDPKMVELVPFNGLPHVIGKVETNLDRIAAVLRWVVLEMERRYKKFEDLRARDLKSYNRKARRRKETEPLPRLVVLIDELADLMMSAAEQTEATLVRLAQMGRATGIHLVVATQRPSTDVVTGLIKANFPARLSFAVASGVDSRVILDETGAETLLGRGDMLFLAPEAGTTVRSQGVMVGDQEIEAVIKFWREYWEDGEEASPWDVMIQEEGVMADRDDLVEKAIEEITSSGKANASHLQRKLRIGYPRAARLMDELEDMGIVGPARGSGREREVLIDQEDEENGEED
ncbi:MAG: DNA translocase FtsK, partial [Anaerolineae bacterium]|nr:DNA translocase FtsK [Anaerolineae bacterium]